MVYAGDHRLDCGNELCNVTGRRVLNILAEQSIKLQDCCWRLQCCTNIFWKIFENKHGSGEALFRKLSSLQAACNNSVASQKAARFFQQQQHRTEHHLHHQYQQQQQLPPPPPTAAAATTTPPPPLRAAVCCCWGAWW